MAAAAVLALLLAFQDAAPARLLAEAVDAPSPAERAKAAAALARRSEISLDEWLEAARAFGTFAPEPPGVKRESVELWNGEAVRSYELFWYVPKRYDPVKPAPLLLALHGSDGRGDEVHPWWHAAADALGMIVVAPSDPAAKDGYTFTPKEREAGLAAIRASRRRFNVDENRVFASGFSRGGHMTWDLALRNPDLFAGIAPMLGGPWPVLGGDRNNLRYLQTLTGLPIRDLQGARDDPKLVADLRYAMNRLRAFGAKNATLVEFPELGHAFDFDAVPWTEFWGSCRREPVPPSAVAMTAGRPPAGHASGRAFYAEILAVKSTVVEEPKLRVTKAQWDAMDDDRKRQWMSEEAEKATARLEVAFQGKGTFSVKSTGVTKARILCTAMMADPKEAAVVNYNGKTQRHPVKWDAAVLLSEFVERFDRAFLPVAEIRLDSP